MDVSETLVAALKKASVREVAARARVPRRSVQGILDGHVPSLIRAEKILAALDLVISIRPLRAEAEGSASNVAPGTQVMRPLTMFGWRLSLPVREWAHCSPEGYFSEPSEDARAPAPLDLLDDEAFYGQMMGQSMLREGIGANFYCLISPNTEPDVGQLVWLRNHAGQEVIRRLVAADGQAYTLLRWGPADEHGHQVRAEERWTRGEIHKAGVVLAVYAGWPSVKSPPFRVPVVAGSEAIRGWLEDELATLLGDLVKHLRASQRSRPRAFRSRAARARSGRVSALAAGRSRSPSRMWTR